MTVAGTLAAVASAISYGVNPLGALKLYQIDGGYSPISVLLFRFGYASLALFVWTMISRQEKLLPRREMFWTMGLGVLFAISSITFYYSFQSLGAGLASTLVFLYPIFVTFLMCLFFHEKFSWRITFATLLALAGVSVLANASEAKLTFGGIAMAVASAFAYAVYIVSLRQAKLKSALVPTTFWTMFFTFSAILAFAAVTGGSMIVFPKSIAAVGWGLFLGVCPSLVSLVLLSYALKRIGPTPTAIYGALEPPTAVLVGCLVFHEAFSMRIAIGIAFVLVSVAIVILRSATRRRPTG